MNESPQESAGADMLQGKAKLLIVDDDPVASSMLAFVLKKHGYEVGHVASGEACLATLDEFAPEVILLDIEMPGIDGYETCRCLRGRFDQANLGVIFLSAHDTLEERLRAYDVGGDDFVSKPFATEEIRRKIALAAAARIRRRRLVEEKASLEETADIAMQGYNEMGALLKFTRSALGCRTLQGLAELVIDSLRAAQIECHVQLRGSATAGTLTLTSRGPASPLEESVIERMRTQDRIFQFKSRMIVNYENVSLLVVNMPADDEVLSGRIRDHASMIAETADEAIENISLRADAVARAQELRQLAAAGHAGIEQLQASHRAQQMETRCELEQMVDRIEAMYYRLGLSDSQEAAVSNAVRASRDGVLQLFDRYRDVCDSQFATVLEGLNRASAYQVDMAESSSQASEVWV